MTTFLIGGGWSAAARSLVYGPFLDAAGSHPAVACVVIDEGDGSAQFDRWADALSSTAACTPLPVLVAAGDTFDVSSLGDADAVLVCGGHTPSYAAALRPAANALASWLGERARPYAGFSAGASIAARDALVGGWRMNGIPVCPEDASEDLDEVSVVPGLALVPFAVDVHAAQWGTLNRVIASVGSGRLTTGMAIDEDTVVVVEGGEARVAGIGRAHVVSPTDTGVHVRSWRTGEQIDIDVDLHP